MRAVCAESVGIEAAGLNGILSQLVLRPVADPLRAATALVVAKPAQAALSGRKTLVAGNQFSSGHLVFAVRSGWPFHILARGR